MEHDLDKARNLKLLLSAFEQMSCLKINFYKCELFCYEEAVEAATDYADLFGVWGSHGLRGPRGDGPLYMGRTGGAV